MVFDTHTHRIEPEPDTYSVFTILPLEEPLQALRHCAYSAGIHPWYLQLERLPEQLHAVEKWLQQDKVVALGECGLDRLKGPLLEQQKIAFVSQVTLAEELRKPVIIHCVKAFPELLEIRKKLRPQSRWIIHGFNNKPEVAHQLIKSGCYLSLGSALLRPDSNAVKVLKEMPLKRLLLETDDTNNSIREIYAAAALELTLPESELIQQIGRTFAEVFQKP